MSGTTGNLLTQATAGTPVPPWLLAQLVRTESGGDPNARNPASGASGLGGVLPSTAASPGFGVQPLSPAAPPEQQLRFSAEYLAARGKALGLKPEDWNDPAKAGAALVAYHGPERDANGVDGADYARKVLGLDPAGAAAALGIYTNMVGQSSAAIQSGMAAKERATRPIYEQMQTDLAADRLRFDKAAKDLTPVEKIPPPTPPQSDPLKAFGSVAGLFAIVAAAFSKQPAINAMVGLTGAINGARQADEDAFNKNYKIWKDQTEAAIANHRLQAQDMNEALEKMKTDLTTGVAMARAVSAQFDDPIAMQLLANGQYHTLAELQMQRGEITEKMIKEGPAALASLQYMRAQAFGTPEEKQAATENLNLVLTHGDKPGTPAYDKNILVQDNMAHGMSKPEAILKAEKDLAESKAAAKPPSAAGAKEKDAEALAVDAFKQAHDGKMPGPADEAEMARLRNQQRTEAGGVISDEAANLAADRVLAGDERATTGMARSAANITKVTNAIVTRAQAKGMSGADIATKVAEFAGTTAGERTLGTRTANMEVAANEVKNMAPLALAASKAVDRSQFPSLNAILLAGERGSGDENVVRFGLAANSLIYTYAKFLNPTGIPTDADKARATDILSTAWTQGQFEAAVDQIRREISSGQKAITDTRGEFREGVTGTGGQQSQAPAQKSWKYNAAGPGGVTIHSDDGSNWFTPDGKPYGAQ